MNTEEEQNKLSEPESVYEKTGLRKFESYDEMEDDQLKYFASLSPEELLRNLRKMQLSVFGNHDANPPGRTIKFNKHE